jgi:putative lipoic acid-binding regulatory protein
MGNYDPIQEDMNNETTDGNILQALMKFPSRYTFNVVGKTKGDEQVTESYINHVKDIVLEISGDKDLQYESIPRGKNFVKIKIETTVESAAMINMIYEKLDKHELTKMRF